MTSYFTRSLLVTKHYKPQYFVIHPSTFTTDRRRREIVKYKFYFESYLSSLRFEHILYFMIRPKEKYFSDEYIVLAMNVYSWLCLQCKWQASTRLRFSRDCSSRRERCSQIRTTLELLMCWKTQSYKCLPVETVLPV